MKLKFSYHVLELRESQRTVVQLEKRTNIIEKNKEPSIREGRLMEE